MLSLLTDFASSRRGKWLTLVGWLLVSGALLSQLPRLDEVRENEQALFLPRDAEATRAFELARERFPAAGTPLLVVFSEPAGLSERTFAAAGDLAMWLTGSEAPAGVQQVRVPGADPAAYHGLVSPDGTTLNVYVDVGGEPAEASFAATVEAIRERTAALDLPGVEVAVGGPGGLIVDLVGVFSQIDTFLLLVTVAVVLVLLVLIYRSPVMAMLPLLTVGLVFQLAGGIAAWTAGLFDLPVSGQTTGIMTVVLFGTGTDYVLFVSARFREELATGTGQHEAMRRTMRAVGGSVASAGMTILVASVALAFATLRSYQALGPVIALAVALMMLAALTLVPALLAILGRGAYWPSRPRPSSGAAAHSDWRHTVYGRIGGIVLRRPRTVLGVTTACLALLLSGLLVYQPNYDPLESLPTETESVRSFELLRAGFPPGQLAPTQVYVALPPGQSVLDPLRLRQIDTLTLALSEHPAVADAAGPSRPFGTAGPPLLTQPALEPGSRFVSPDGSVGRIDVVLATNPYGDDALDAIAQLRQLARTSAAEARLTGDILVGGETAEGSDTRSAGNRDTVVVLPLILLAIGVVLALLLRSLVAPLYLMATIAFTYFATLGLAAGVFIGLLGHNGIGQSVPFFLFVFLNALSVDYNIYLMSRVREEARHAPLAEATGRALSRTGPVITSAGLILAGTFSALMSLPLQDLTQLGFAVAAGVLIDTFITRTVIVPALVILFGRWNWWPSRLGGEVSSDLSPGPRAH